MIALALAVLAGAAAPARADVLPQFVGLPGNYLPNTPFTFELRAPGLTALTEFSLDLIIETPSPDPVTLLSVSVVRPGDADYPFGATGSFSTSQTSFPVSTRFTIHIEGASAGPGVDTTPGLNDLLATITVLPGPGMVEPITFSIDPVSMLFNALTESGQGLQAPDPVTVFPEQTDPPTPTPAPAGVVLLGIGGVVLAARRRVARGS
jgi:hypothetical protein